MQHAQVERNRARQAGLGPVRVQFGPVRSRIRRAAVRFGPHEAGISPLRLDSVDRPVRR
jgi:hypothetical protein